MNALARYLLVFLLGWSGAIWTYSDLIYKKVETPQGNKDISSPKELEKESSTQISGSEQPEGQTMEQDVSPTQN